MEHMVIHFGYFVRWQRLNMGLSRRAFGQKIELTERQLIRIEKDPEPKSQDLTMVKIAKGLEIDPGKLDSIWRKTPVPAPDEQLETDHLKIGTGALRKKAAKPSRK